MINVVKISAIGTDNHIPFMPNQIGISIKHTIGSTPRIIVNVVARLVFWTDM